LAGRFDKVAMQRLSGPLDCAKQAIQRLREELLLAKQAIQRLQQPSGRLMGRCSG